MNCTVTSRSPDRITVTVARQKPYFFQVAVLEGALVDVCRVFLSRVFFLLCLVKLGSPSSFCRVKLFLNYGVLGADEYIFRSWFL